MGLRSQIIFVFSIGLMLSASLAAFADGPPRPEGDFCEFCENAPPADPPSRDLRRSSNDIESHLGGKDRERVAKLERKLKQKSRSLRCPRGDELLDADEILERIFPRDSDRDLLSENAPESIARFEERVDRRQEECEEKMERDSDRPQQAGLGGGGGGQMWASALQSMAQIYMQRQAFQSTSQIYANYGMPYYGGLSNMGYGYSLPANMGFYSPGVFTGR